MAPPPTIATATAATLQALCRSNIRILRQKLALMDVMTTKFGTTEAKLLYAKTCPIVHASVGQHIRHSMDHMELATNVAAAVETSNNNNSNPKELHYDVRQRGGDDEHDIEEAQKRIERAVETLNSVLTSSSESSESDANDNNRDVRAYFMLSGDPQEFNLPSTIEREMGFAAHHAIHHMAMVKIIAQETLGISDDLPLDFGKAPSTIVYDNANQNENNNPQSP